MSPDKNAPGKPPSEQNEPEIAEKEAKVETVEADETNLPINAVVDRSSEKLTETVQRSDVNETVPQERVTETTSSGDGDLAKDSCDQLPLGTKCKCKLCKHKCYPMKPEMMRHALQHLKHVSFKCSSCDYKTLHFDKLEQHSKRKHENVFFSILTVEQKSEIKKQAKLCFPRHWGVSRR